MQILPGIELRLPIAFSLPQTVKLAELWSNKRNSKQIADRCYIEIKLSSRQNLFFSVLTFSFLANFQKIGFTSDRAWY